MSFRRPELLTHKFGLSCHPPHPENWKLEKIDIVDGVVLLERQGEHSDSTENLCVTQRIMFNMDFDDDTLSHEFQAAADCLFSDVLVDIGDDVAADHLFDDVDLNLTSNDLTDIIQLADSTGVDPPPSPMMPDPVTVTPTKQTTRRLKHNGIGRRRTTTLSKRPSRPTSRNAARERSRVKSLRSAFLRLQNSLPSVPPNTKLSKLDVLVLATTYIAHLMKTLDESTNLSEKDVDPTTILSWSTTDSRPTEESSCSIEVRHHRLHEKGYLHPVRKWPMRSRLYAGAFDVDKRQSVVAPEATPPNGSSSSMVGLQTMAVRCVPPAQTSLTNNLLKDVVMSTLPPASSCTFDQLFGFST